MPPQQKVIILKETLFGDWIDDEGNMYNEDLQRVDYLGRVIPEPEEEPATSSLGNGGAGVFQPQTLADYNRPDLFYHRRAAIQVDMDCLDEELPNQDFQFQNRGVQSRCWYDAPFQVQEAPVHQDSKYGEFDFDAWQTGFLKSSDATKPPAIVVDLETKELVEIKYLSEAEERDEVSAFFKCQEPLSIDTAESVDRQGTQSLDAQILQSRVSIDTPPGVDRQSELSPDTQKAQRAVSIDMDLCVDRQSAQKTVSIDTNISVDRQSPQSQTQIADQRGLSIDTPPSVDRQPVKLTAIEFSVDRHDPQTQISQNSVSIDTPMYVARQKAKKDTPPPEPPEYVPELLPEPKPPERYDTDVGEVFSHGDTYELTVIPEEAATPGSCHKRKSPATTLQPPLKRMRTHIGAVVVYLVDAYIIDPRDTYVVYSRGPRPPPPEQWYVLSNPPSSSAGRRSYPPRQSHPNAAYLPDPEATNVVYHMGPRPP